MGFDLEGVDATSEKGSYFRNNVWWWRPLWEFVVKVCGDILDPEDYDKCMYNNGHLINREKSKGIAHRLKTLIYDCSVHSYAEAHKKKLADMPDVICELCNGSGERHDAIIDGKCNGCSGTGKKRPWDCSYPFSEDNVREFVEFLDENGGFKVW